MQAKENRKLHCTLSLSLPECDSFPFLPSLATVHTLSHNPSHLGSLGAGMDLVHLSQNRCHTFVKQCLQSQMPTPAQI
jgi:hypothetical protein